jgi:hypothetical protein
VKGCRALARLGLVQGGEGVSTDLIGDSKISQRIEDWKHGFLS